MSEKSQSELASQEAPGTRRWSDTLEAEAVACQDWDSEVNRPQAESISVSSVWQMDSPSTADEALAGKAGTYVYRRDGHPNERTLADKLAKLHGGASALITAQGMSAIGAVALTVLRPNSTVWVSEELYGKTHSLFLQDLVKWQVSTRLFDPTSETDVQELANCNCDMVLIETLSNPRLRVSDIGELATAAKSANALLVVDNTFATHLICRPLDYGADLVVESLGKQVNGHSDAMLGLVVGNSAELISQIGSTLSTFGMASSPLDCYLTHRGLMSLALRVQRACDNALALAKAIQELTCVQSVDYPGLATHAEHTISSRQFTGGYGWMLSFHIKSDQEGVLTLFNKLRPEIPFVPSLGDVATTVSHPASTSHRGLTKIDRTKLGISEGTIRVSCGVEPTDWLLKRFQLAFREAQL